jgi:hypothetical protein
MLPNLNYIIQMGFGSNKQQKKKLIKEIAAKWKTHNFKRVLKKRNRIQFLFCDLHDKSYRVSLFFV